jgi:hypothetical protein
MIPPEDEGAEAAVAVLPPVAAFPPVPADEASRETAELLEQPARAPSSATPTRPRALDLAMCANRFISATPLSHLPMGRESEIPLDGRCWAWRCLAR